MRAPKEDKYINFACYPSELRPFISSLRLSKSNRCNRWKIAWPNAAHFGEFQGPSRTHIERVGLAETELMACMM